MKMIVMDMDGTLLTQTTNLTLYKRSLNELTKARCFACFSKWQRCQ